MPFVVAVGAEGFWGPGARREEANPGAWGAQTGQNFTVNHLPPAIDFAAIHVWPDNWQRCASQLTVTDETMACNQGRMTLNIAFCSFWAARFQRKALLAC